jgi:hypothetical protein
MKFAIRGSIAHMLIYKHYLKLFLNLHVFFFCWQLSRKSNLNTEIERYFKISASLSTNVKGFKGPLSYCQNF